MTDRFIYTNKVGAGPEHPNKQWGLFSAELTAEEAKARYELDAARREDWFGIVLLKDGDVRPTSYLQMCPRANGVVLQKVNQYGSVVSSYTWGAYYTPAANETYDGELKEIFLHKIVWYAYPEEAEFFDILDSLGHVSMSFRPDGYAKKEVVTDNGFNRPSEVETREFRDVDVSANRFQIPEFGNWDALFHPDPGQ